VAVLGLVVGRPVWALVKGVSFDRRVLVSGQSGQQGAA
jgi:hypothetical protein